MIAAISMFVLLSLSVLLVRTAAVALRLTGLSEQTARFQALSAFSGTGFTTTEAEMMVNYPLRRRIISLLMIIGNVGLVSVLSTVVVSMMNSTQTDSGSSIQLIWLLGSMLLLWMVMLNPLADRLMCKLISTLLQRYTLLGRRSYEKLLQLGEGVSICEHPVSQFSDAGSERLDDLPIRQQQLMILAVSGHDGADLDWRDGVLDLSEVRSVVLFGPDSAHEALGIDGQRDH